MSETSNDANEKKRTSGAFDDLLTSIGQFGSYQRRLYVLLCLPALVCALHKLAWVFLGAQASHRCLLPFESLSNASFALPGQVANMSLPWDAARDSWSQCRRLDANFSEQYFEDGVPATETVPCEDWVFDYTEYQSSAVFEFDLVCGLEWARAGADTMLMLGNLVGSIIFGDLSDRLGRRPVFFSALVLQVLAGVLAWAAPNYWSFVLARTVVGATVPGVYIVGYVIGIEMVGPSKRQFAGVLLNMFFSIGYMLTALFAFLITDWRTLQLALSLPGLLFLVYWWLIPESPRWLLGRGRVDEAKVILQKAAAENKRGISPLEVERMVTKIAESNDEDPAVTTSQRSLLEVWRYPNLRTNTLVIFLAWFVLSMSYYGLSWNTGNLGGNDYVNFVISGAVEIPAYLFVMLGLTRWGRRLMLSGNLLVGATALVMTVFVPPDLGWVITTLAMIGKMALTAAFGVIYLFSSEIFPTCVRNAGMGASSMLNGFGGMLAPFVILLSNVWSKLPFLVLGLLALVTGIVTLRLPETLNQDLPDTIEDGEKFGRKEKNLIENTEETRQRF